MKFKLPIGDWSDDGHGKQEIFVVETNKEIEYIREMYFQACNKLGFQLDGHHELSPCAEYEDSLIKPETIKALRNFGLKISEEEEKQWTTEYVQYKELCKLVLDFIKTQDEAIEFYIIPEDDMPQFQFYGYDEKKRHIGYFGYGLFD